MDPVCANSVDCFVGACFEESLHFEVHSAKNDLLPTMHMQWAIVTSVFTSTNCNGSQETKEPITPQVRYLRPRAQRERGKMFSMKVISKNPSGATSQDVENLCSKHCPHATGAYLSNWSVFLWSAMMLLGHFDNWQLTQRAPLAASTRLWQSLILWDIRQRENTRMSSTKVSGHRSKLGGFQYMKFPVLLLRTSTSSIFKYWPTTHSRSTPGSMNMTLQYKLQCVPSDSSCLTHSAHRPQVLKYCA